MLNRLNTGWTNIGKVLVLLTLLLETSSLLASAVDYEKQSISLALPSEPPSLDSVLTSDSLSFFVLSHLSEGLLQYDQHERLVGGVAERWQFGEKYARFWLRKTARWSDGQPVTAHDFVYAWRRALDPASASSYAFLLYPVKNAKPINAGELPLDALGVKAINDYELVVELDKPCAYFLSLTAFATYHPQRQDFVEKHGRRYAAEADTLLFNGPFVLDRWVHGAALTLKKNPLYWNHQSIRLNEIVIDNITSDLTAILNLFKNGEIAQADLDADTIDSALQSRLHIRRYLTGYLYFMRFNLREQRITSNKKIRQAMQLVFDSSTYANKVVGRPGILPGRSLFPMSVRGVSGPLQEEYPPPSVTLDLQKARDLLGQAKQELGVEHLPALTLLTFDSASALRQAEYLQNLFRLSLGLEIHIDRQVAKQRFAKEDEGDFDIVLSGWGPDYDDGMTFGDLFASWNSNNRGRYISDEYDHWVSVAQNSLDPLVRAEAFAHMQALIHQDVVILPLYESALSFVQHPQLRGVALHRFSGDYSFRFAYVAEAE